jgi:hypothetical protein
MTRLIVEVDESSVWARVRAGYAGYADEHPMPQLDAARLAREEREAAFARQAQAAADERRTRRNAKRAGRKP